MKCVTDLIDNMHTVVELQLKDLRRAIHGTGNCALCRSFYLPSRNIPGVACDVRREKGSGFLPVPGKFQQSIPWSDEAKKPDQRQCPHATQLLNGTAIS